MEGTGGASASLLRTPEFFTEEVPGIPGGPIRVRGHVKSQEKVRFGEKGGSVQIHRLVQIVGGLMVACSSPLSPRPLTRSQNTDSKLLIYGLFQRA